MARWRIVATALIGLAIASVARGADAKGAAAPATTQAAILPARHEAVIPTGFHLITAGGLKAICLAEDEAWVKQALQSVKPGTRPTTTAADILTRLEDQRSSLAKEMASDLGIQESDTTAFLDSDLRPLLESLDQLRPPIFYLAIKNTRLKELIKSGWNDPRFSYDAKTDDVRWSLQVKLAVDRPLDDTVMPAVYGDADPPDKKKFILTKTIEGTEDNVMNSVASQGPSLMQQKLAMFMVNKVLDPLKLKTDQEWFGLGVARVLCAKYMSQLTGVPRAAIVRAMEDNPAANPLSSASVDALHPTDTKDLLPQYGPMYVDAIARKATAAIDFWVNQAGDSAIAKTLAAWHAAPPHDGPELVKLIKDTTGVDLTPKLTTSY